MTRSVLERLRPPTRQPDPAWAVRTLEAILRAPGESQSEPSLLAPTSPGVGCAPARTQAGARRRAALVAAVVVGLAATGVGVHLGLDARTRTLLAEPAAPAQPNDMAPIFTDRGPLPAGQMRRLQKACSLPAEAPFVGVEVHYARSTSNAGSEVSRQAAVVEDRRGEYRLCVSPPVAPNVSNTELAGYGPGVLGPHGDLSPTNNRPMSVIATHQWYYQRDGERFVDVRLAVAYAVTPAVDRVEVRLSGAGADGRWFAGTVHGGFVYIPLAVPELDAPDGTPAVAIESRGYGPDGQLVASDRQPYLNGDRDSHGDERAFWR